VGRSLVVSAEVHQRSQSVFPPKVCSEVIRTYLPPINIDNGSALRILKLTGQTN